LDPFFQKQQTSQSQKVFSEKLLSQLTSLSQTNKEKSQTFHSDEKTLPTIERQNIADLEKRLFLLENILSPKSSTDLPTSKDGTISLLKDVSQLKERLAFLSNQPKSSSLDSLENRLAALTEQMNKLLEKKTTSHAFH
jgi:hypothetical protein